MIEIGSTIVKNIFFVSAIRLMAFAGITQAEAPVDHKAVKSTDRKYFDAKGDPTYNLGTDSTVDWYTFSGYR